jgi:hypothetical protein
MDDVTISKGEISRRDFVKLALATGISTSVVAHPLAAETPVNEIPRHTLGDAGEQVSRLGRGGSQFGKGC